MIVRKVLISTALALSVLAAMPQAAFAEHGEYEWHGGREWRGGREWHGDIRHFREHDLHRWRGGHWLRGRHDGYMGWWWVVGGLWYFYSAPVYPFPDPYVPPVVVEQAPLTPSTPVPPPPSSAPQGQYWYYCGPAGGYYPYVATCPSGWKKVPATPPDAPPQ